MTFILCILDGWGCSEANNKNAIKHANKPNYDWLLANYPHSFLEASGTSVGLPEGQVGNSEVGHITIGSGRVIFQDLPRINNAISNGEYEKNPKILELISSLLASSKTCHILGIASDGGVHGHIDHFITTCNIFKKNGIKVMAHAFADGRDTAPKSSLQYLKKIEEAGINIATISGRYYAMDRDNRYDRTEKAYRTIVLAEAPKFTNYQNFINSQYARNITDEFIEPHAADFYQGINDGDALIFINYRADRIRQLCSSLIEPNFQAFPITHPKLSKIISMSPYSTELSQYSEIIFPNEAIKNTLGEVLAKSGKSQLRLAETEKYAHVTYFFNGGIETPYPKEKRILIPSPKVATYDLTPSMSCYEICNQVIESCHSNNYDFICVNFANADMVGHTGVFEAAVKAIEVIDECLGKIIKTVKQTGSELLITADHGNAEQMFNPATKQPLTSHTLNKVPFIYVGPKRLALKDGKLSDVAPTILKLFGLPQPSEMTGSSLLLLN